MVELTNVCAGYEKREILHNINMTFQPGKITVLIGPNGCGKSTLLKTMVRILPHTSGEILVSGKSVETYKSTDLAKEIAYLPQKKSVPDISVLRMVLHGRFAYLGYPRRYSERDIAAARRALDWAGLSHLEEENVSRLSGGMQQRVYIAMALAQDANTILMDEPTTYLDVSHQLCLMEMARQLTGAGKAVVMVLHDLSQALRTADQVYVLNQGKLCVSGSPEEVFHSGALQQVFGVSVEKVFTETGWHYICNRVKEMKTEPISVVYKENGNNTAYRYKRNA